MRRIEPSLEDSSHVADGEAKDLTLPILLKFVDIAEHLSEGDPIAAALATKLGQDAALASVALSAHVLLLIDGLDEIGSDSEQRSDLLRKIVKPLDDEGPHQLIVLTTRPSRANGEQLPPFGFQALHLLPPSPKAAQSLMGSANDSLVGADPLRLRMLRVVADDLGTDKTASLSRHSLYREIIRILLDRIVDADHSADQLRGAIRKFGHENLKSGLRRLGEQRARVRRRL